MIYKNGYKHAAAVISHDFTLSIPVPINSSAPGHGQHATLVGGMRAISTHRFRIDCGSGKTSVRWIVLF